MRPRFTIDGDAWKRACEYAELTNRSPAGMIAEALEYYHDHYPRRTIPNISRPSPESLRKSRTMLDFRMQIEKDAKWFSSKKDTFERDDYTCQHCGATNTSIIPHHIKRRRFGGPDDPSNLITLCRKCHGQAHSKKGIDL